MRQAADTANTSIDKTSKTQKNASQTGTKSVSEWAKSFANLDHAFSSSVTGMILGTTTWQKTVQRLSQMALSDMINLAQKELATWIGKETAKTTVTKTANATRDASDKTSQSGFFSLIAQTLARWLGLEFIEDGGERGGQYGAANDRYRCRRGKRRHGRAAGHGPDTDFGC